MSCICRPTLTVSGQTWSSLQSSVPVSICSNPVLSLPKDIIGTTATVQALRGELGFRNRDKESDLITGCPCA